MSADRDARKWRRVPKWAGIMAGITARELSGPCSASSGSANWREASNVAFMFSLGQFKRLSTQSASGHGRDSLLFFDPYEVIGVDDSGSGE